jgi:hypothetical protein
MLAFLLFIMPYIVLYVWFALTGKNPVGGWSWLPFYTALTSGLFGALFSRERRNCRDRADQERERRCRAN